MRIVVDTNVIASAIFFGGKPKVLLDLIVRGQVDVIVSPDIAEEYRETVSYLISKYPERHPFVPLTQIISSMKMIRTVTEVHVCRDPDDDKFISCAIDGKCVYIVSGDKDLLTLERYGEIEILTVADFLEKYR